MSFNSILEPGSLNAPWNNVYHDSVLCNTLTATNVINTSSAYVVCDNSGGTATSLLASGSAVAVPFSRVLTNVGMTLSVSNSTVTVPVDGVYQVTLLEDTTLNGSVGGVVEYIIANTSIQHNMISKTSTASGVSTTCFSSSVVLSAGESIAIEALQVGGNATMSTGNNNNVQFIVALIQQLA